MHEPTCTQTYVPFDLVVFTSFFILGYLWFVRLRPQPPRAVNGVVVETPRVAGLNPAVVGGHGVSVSSQSRRPSFVERQANREVVDEVAITPQTRHITSPRSPIAQGTRPEPTGHNDEAEPRNSRRSPTHSPTPSVHANTRGSTLGVVQPVVRGHGLTLVTDLPNTVELRGATVPTPGASGIPAIRSPVVQGIRRAAFARIGRSGWRAPSPLSETERKKLGKWAVFSPHSYQYDHRLGAIDEVLDSAEQHQESMFYHTSQPSSPSTLSQLSTVGGKRNSTLIKALAGCDLSRAVAPLAILAVGVSAENLPGPDHDLEWISRTFSAVRFYALKGRLATEKGIRSALKHMFENAESVLTLVLYLTGHGNSGNVFELYGEQPLSEATLCRWIDEFRKTTGKHLPVLLVFDFCRQNISAPMVSTHELTDIYIIWACTPGERSYEVNLGDDLPYSDLLKVFCLTLHKMRAFPPQSPRCLMRKIAIRVSRIIRIHRGIICGRRKCPVPWNECICPDCLAGKPCSHERHSSEDDIPVQTPIAWFSGFGNDVEVNTALDAIRPILRYVTEPIQRAATDIVGSKWYRMFVPQDRPSQRSSMLSESPPQSISSPVQRGMSLPLVAAAVAPSS